MHPLDFFVLLISIYIPLSTAYLDASKAGMHSTILDENGADLFSENMGSVRRKWAVMR